MLLPGGRRRSLRRAGKQKARFPGSRDLQRDSLEVLRQTEQGHRHVRAVRAHTDRIARMTAAVPMTDRAAKGIPRAEGVRAAKEAPREATVRAAIVLTAQTARPETEADRAAETVRAAARTVSGRIRAVTETAAVQDPDRDSEEMAPRAAIVRAVLEIVRAREADRHLETAAEEAAGRSKVILLSEMQRSTETTISGR